LFCLSLVFQYRDATCILARRPVQIGLPGATPFQDVLNLIRRPSSRLQPAQSGIPSQDLRIVDAAQIAHFAGRPARTPRLKVRLHMPERDRDGSRFLAATWL